MTTTTYVSLGDSISIDDYAGGAGRGAASLLYKNIDEDFSEFRSQSISAHFEDSRFVPLAKDGATSERVLATQLPLFRELASVPDIVTLTIGGNDLLHHFGNDEMAEQAIATLAKNVPIILQEIRAAAPDAKIIAGTVYDPTDGTSDCAAAGLKPWPRCTEFIVEMNERLKQIYTAADVAVADLHAHFLGHGLTAGNPAQVEAKPDPALWFCGHVEPNAWGASEVRRCFWDAAQPL